jgi:hypothetical protein
MHEGQAPAIFTMPAGLAELMHELEQHWPAMQHTLRASGAPLNDETEAEREAREKREAEEAAAAKKPWGDDKDFDPEKAWKLITNLRADVDRHKKRADGAEAKLKEIEDSKKSESERDAEARAAAEKKAADAELDVTRLRVAMSKGLSETQAKRLVGTTKEELEADADELLETFKSEGDGGSGSGSGSGGRPKEKLKPGAAPEAEPEENDPLKLAEAVPRPY